MNYVLDAGPMIVLFWKEAATFKGTHAMALPDTFCLALARRLSGTVATADHDEFDFLSLRKLARLGFCSTLPLQAVLHGYEQYC